MQSKSTVYLREYDLLFDERDVFAIVNGLKQTELVGLVYGSGQEIDGHWLVRITNPERPRLSDLIHDEVIGVTSHRDRLDAKTSECARNYAREYALASQCEFVDETGKKK